MAERPASRACSSLRQPVNFSRMLNTLRQGSCFPLPQPYKINGFVAERFARRMAAGDIPLTMRIAEKTVPILRGPDPMPGHDVVTETIPADPIRRRPDVQLSASVRSQAKSEGTAVCTVLLRVLEDADLADIQRDRVSGTVDNTNLQVGLAVNPWPAQLRILVSASSPCPVSQAY